MQGCAVRKIEESPVLWNCKIKGGQHMTCMKKLIFSCRARGKVGRQEPVGSARVQSWVQRKRIHSGGYKLYVIFEYVVFQSDSGARTSKLLVTFWSWRRTFSSFNLCPFSPSIATDDIKRFECLIIVFSNKTGPLLLEFNWFEDTF